jgi:prepilin-type N-terminal cleavage/methylation domain-containing protein
MNLLSRHSKGGFTIVELLIVIVVIGILAAITIVAYNGIQDRARVSSLQSDLNKAAKSLELSLVDSPTNNYPTSLPATAVASSGTAFNFTNPAGLDSYCLSAINGNLTYHITSQIKAAVIGDCPSTSGLVGWWPFNNTARDYSGVSNTGTMNGVPVPATGQSGVSNSAYNFDGSDTISTTVTNFPIGSSARSIFAWVYVSAYPSTGLIMASAYGTGGTNFAAGLGVNTLGRVGFYGQGNDFSSTLTVPLNTWSVIGYNINGAQATIWLNEQSQTGTLPNGAANTQAATHYIGSWVGGSSFRWNGLIDDVRVYNRILSLGEVQALYRTGTF